jgi:apolipoprotein N-acyltransferase
MPSQAPRAIDAPATADRRRTLALGLLGSLLCYLAHPPAGWSWLAWVGPVPWLLLIRDPALAGRRPYRALWLAGAAFWLAAVQWIRLPHWANIFGLFLLAAYLGAYLPVFVALSRVAVHRAGAPLWLAAPVVWTGLEWLRARLLTGFLMASLAHTQSERLYIIQIADAFGEYGVTFLIILVAACIADAWARFSSEPGRPRPRRALRAALRLLPAAVALIAAISYGHMRLLNAAFAAKTHDVGPTIALIQSNMPADWKGTAERDDAVMREMMDLSRQSVAASSRPVDLVVWPETMYRRPLLMLDPQRGPPAAMFDAERIDETRRDLAARSAELSAALLAGLDRYCAVKDDQQLDESGRPTGYRIEAFNSAACLDQSGKLAGTYDKMHLLPFGEFIPFVRWFPFLRNYSPITGGAIPGELPAPIVVGGVRYSVNICYETVLPQLIRRQFMHLAATDSGPPDVLVNLTNDAWYWGSSELDMHLASGVFRAVEMNRPLVIAANRGLSAHIDHTGRVMAVSERNVPTFVIARLRTPPSRITPFARWGDWFALACLICCMVLAAFGWATRRRE